MRVVAVATPQEKPGAGAIPLPKDRPSRLAFPSTERSMGPSIYRLSAAVSSGFARGKVRKATRDVL
jgi:hypothetical protein